MIRDQELRDTHERLEELLVKVPQEYRHQDIIPILITTCMTFARVLDTLNDRQDSIASRTDQALRSIRADLAAVQALTHR